MDQVPLSNGWSFDQPLLEPPTMDQKDGEEDGKWQKIGSSETPGVNLMVIFIYFFLTMLKSFPDL